MASDHQMTVSRTSKSLPPAPMSKSTRQVVPAFLQKLYEMVNDPKNSDLIRWSDAGDSFFVLDHERFAHDVLGRWFKHRNFSSFVRQLNMYGFHKIPHLQQGVLKSDNETEFWNFAHPNFHRGQPDLLCLIQRKKTANQSTNEDIEVRDASPSASGGSSSSGQVLDVQSIVNGIAAIKRHQTTISAELNELKRSNQLLWQDAMAARQRHQKQQDTINRIVKFLAGVFGNQVNRSKADPSSPVVIPRARFMIEDAKRDGKKSIVELDDMDDMPTPISINSMDDAASTTSEAPIVDTPKTTNDKRLSEPPTERSVTPRSTAPPVFDFDPRMLGQLSSTSLQQLLGSLASQPIPDPPPHSSTSSSDPTPTTANHSSHLTPYQPPPSFDFPLSAGSNADDDTLFAPSFQVPSEGLISFNNFDGYPQDRVERQWEQAEDIDRDVNALNTSIHNLIQTFGLDPTLLDNAHVANPPSSTVDPSTAANPSELPTSTDPAMNLDLGSLPNTASEFDFDSFLNTLPSADFSESTSTAFLDEVPSPVNPDSPMVGLRPVSPEVPTNATSSPRSYTIGQQSSTAPSNLGTGSTTGRKRKSDVSDIDSSSLHQFQSMMSSSLLTPVGSSSSTAVPVTGSKPKKRKEN